MRGFPRARNHAGNPHAGVAVSVTKALREQAAAAPEPTLLDPQREDSTKSRRARKPGPARPTVRGRPTTPDEKPLTHAPAAERPGEPPLRTGTTAGAPQAAARPQTEAASAAHRPARRRTEVFARDPSRPRPSRVLAELHAALADAATAAE